MLFNAIVKSDKFPAITHVDRTSRIQSINQDCGIIYNILTEYRDRGHDPVLLNTSFNGPRQPIIETIEDAISFLKSTSLDALYLSNLRISKDVTQKVFNLLKSIAYVMPLARDVLKRKRQPTQRS